MIFFPFLLDTMVLSLSLDADFKVFILKNDRMNLEFDKSSSDINSLKLIENDHLISKQEKSK